MPSTTQQKKDRLMLREAVKCLTEENLELRQKGRCYDFFKFDQFSDCIVCALLGQETMWFTDARAKKR